MMEAKTKPSGLIVIISAPSGAGKTTLCKRLAERNRALLFSVSYTTRGCRDGEKEGRDYFFISREDFLKKRQADFFAEWAEVHGDLYGTSREALDKAIRQGRDIVLTIDVQGASQIKKNYPDAVSIFIHPPTPEDLKKRLEERRTESEAAIFMRLARAKEEIEESAGFDYQIINRKLEEAVGELEEKIALEKSKLNQMR